MRHKPRKKYTTEWRLLHLGNDRGWHTYHRYLTVEAREEAMKSIAKKKGERDWCQFRRGKP